MRLITPSNIQHSLLFALLFILLSANSKSFFFREKYGSDMGFYKCIILVSVINTKYLSINKLNSVLSENINYARCLK